MTGYSESVRYTLNGLLRYFAWSHTKMIREHLLNCALKLTKQQLWCNGKNENLEADDLVWNPSLDT